ncbi:hypothetical protein HY839_04725 [Candidatus Azambacteria bacterium]|nr:hypothetical protein [Candidatus Azambacteria bacterium]
MKLQHTSRCKDRRPADHDMALQFTLHCTEGADIGAQCEAITDYLKDRPGRYATVCRRAATLCVSPERKVTFLLEAVHRACALNQRQWRIAFMMQCLEEAKPLFADEFTDDERKNALLERWRDIALTVFHAAGHFHACAEVYQERANAASDNGAHADAFANQFMAKVALCDSALEQGIPQTIQSAVLEVKSVAGRLILTLEDSPLNAYWRMRCFIHVLRAEWLGGFHNPNTVECFAELKKLRKQMPCNFVDALKVLTAAYYTRQSFGEWADALSIAREVALNPRAHPDWRAEAYLVLIFAMEKSGYSKKAIAYINDLLKLPASGGHVARAIADRHLRELTY